MPYITRIALRNCRNIESLDIDLTPGDEVPFRHLILTGPNGSGKTGALEAVMYDLSARSDTSRGLWEVRSHRLAEARHSSREMDDEQRARQVEEKIESDYENALARLTGVRAALRFDTDGVEAHGQAWASSIVAGFSATRRAEFVPSTGPSSVPLKVSAKQIAEPVAPRFVQYLVNRKAEQAFALSDGDEDAARAIGEWFERIEQRIATIVGVSELRLRLDRQTYTFWFDSPELKYPFDIHHLAAGWLSSLYLLGDIVLRAEHARQASGTPGLDPPGIMVVDEVEAHLHLRLQEQILPLLTAMFPRIQFIVATHSPAVISSIPNALVYDLGSRKHYLSDELQGIRYGDLMTSHFGIESDFDLESTRKLERLKVLARKKKRTKRESAELNALAGFLSSRSHTLALEVWAALNDDEDARGRANDVRKSASS